MPDEGPKNQGNENPKNPRIKRWGAFKNQRDYTKKVTKEATVTQETEIEEEEKPETPRVESPQQSQGGGEKPTEEMPPEKKPEEGESLDEARDKEETPKKEPGKEKPEEEEEAPGAEEEPEEAAGPEKPTKVPGAPIEETPGIGAAAGEAGAAGGATATAAGAAGAAGGEAAAGGIVAFFGSPWGIAIIVIIILLIGLIIAFWALFGGFDRFGSSMHVDAQQQSIDKLLAYTGDAVALRKLIVENSDQLKKDLNNLKSNIDAYNLPADKKDAAKKKIDEMIVLIDESKQILSQNTTNIPQAADEKIKKIVSLMQEVRQIMPIALAKGDFALPLGSLTCSATHNNKLHTIESNGHGVFIMHNNASNVFDGGAWDWGVPDDSPVYAIADGKVTKTVKTKYQNWAVIINTPTEDGKSNKYEVAYAHIKPLVEDGETVIKGQVIGNVLKGSMGGPHLQLDLWIDGYPLKEKAQFAYFCGE
ncbi:MAG: M23 family metallopeptidase [Candidatus Berkelbacteria bacterium]|nr:M23 family metallopeptidase [Candidatus Berkelbacteria bacterium]